MKLDLLKTVLLFASIHLLIVWVAERQKAKNNSTRSVALKEGRTILKTQIPTTATFTGLLNTR